MKYLFLLFLTGCTLSAQNENNEHKKDAEFKKLIDSVRQNHNTFYSISLKAKKKEDKLVAQSIAKIITLKEEVKSLRSEMDSVKVRIDTVYIHDTIQITEKKSFWGKTKVDTTNN
jgi:hypothetical protein